MNANTTNTLPGQIVMDLDALETFECKPATSAKSTQDIMLFRENAPDLDDRQVLDYILTLSATRDRDTLVTTLLDHFGTLKGVLEARPSSCAPSRALAKRRPI